MNAKSEPMKTIASARNYEELRADSVAPSPYDYAVLFKGEGFIGRQRAKSRFKLLKALDLKLRHILERGEKVHFVTPGTALSLGERFFAGWLSYYVNRRVLVFTSRRILLLQVDVWQRPLELVSQLPYASIASVKPTWTGALALQLLNRETFYLQHVSRPDRKFLVKFLAAIVQLTNAPFEQKRSIEALCPHCFVFVPEHPQECVGCGGRFKSSGTAGLLSFVFPGVGKWYLGHRSFALLEMLGTGAIWYFLLIAPWTGRLNVTGALIDRNYWMTAGIILFGLHAISGIMTRHFARKGHYPSGEAPTLATLPPFMDRPKPDLDPLNKLTIRRTNPPN